jgi:hypothetical protein
MAFLTPSLGRSTRFDIESGLGVAATRAWLLFVETADL